MRSREPPEYRESKPHMTLEEVIGHVYKGTLEMITTGKVSGEGHQSHPQDLTQVEIEALKKILAKLFLVQQRIELQPTLSDIPLTDVLTSEDAVRVFRNAGMRTVMDVRHADCGRLAAVFAHSMSLLGGPDGKYQLHMYLFCNHDE